MKKRIALLSMMGAVFVFTLALVAFSVYTVNAAVASTVSTTTLDQPAALDAAPATNSRILTDVPSNTADSVEISVQHIGTECHGNAADTPAY